MVNTSDEFKGKMEETTFVADPMRLMIAAAVGIVVLLVLIIKFKLHPVFALVLHFFAWVRLIRKRKTIQMINNFLLVLLENRDSSSPFVICNCWLTDLQPEMVECKQQNCYIELIKSAKGEKNDFS